MSKNLKTVIETFNIKNMVCSAIMLRRRMRKTKYVRISKKKKKKITEREKYYTFLTGRLFLVLFYNEVTYSTCSSLVNFKTKAIFSTFAKEAEVLKII